RVAQVLNAEVRRILAHLLLVHEGEELRRRQRLGRLAAQVAVDDAPHVEPVRVLVVRLERREGQAIEDADDEDRAEPQAMRPAHGATHHLTARRSFCGCAGRGPSCRGAPSPSATARDPSRPTDRARCSTGTRAPAAARTNRCSPTAAPSACAPAAPESPDRRYRDRTRRAAPSATTRSANTPARSTPDPRSAPPSPARASCCAPPPAPSSRAASPPRAA